MIHEELQSLLGVYALDALDPEEAAEVEVHLADCPRCRAEVAAHRETAALLGNAGGEAPPELWGRIAAEVAESSEPSSGPPLPPNVVPFPSRARVPLSVVAAVAACAAAVLGLLGVSTIRLQHRVDALRATASVNGLNQAAAAAMLDPSHRMADLTSPEGQLTAEVVALPDGEAYLYNRGLPALDARRTYQLWGQNQGAVVSLGLLGSDPHVTAFRIDPAVSRLMITAEPQGGRATPDPPVLTQGDVTV